MPYEGQIPLAAVEGRDEQGVIAQQIMDLLAPIGVRPEGKSISKKDGKPSRDVILVHGNAGTGKTHLLAELARRLEESGVQPVKEDEDAESGAVLRYAVISPTNKAATVLRRRGVENTSTIHRIAYVPVFSADMQALTEWLGKPERERDPIRPSLKGHPEETVDRIVSVYAQHRSIPAALAAVGLSGADFISGWTLRRHKVDVALVDEASMLDGKIMEDLRSIFRVIIAFGDPGQLAPIKSSGMAISDPVYGAPFVLETIRRQARENPIVLLAHELQRPDMTYEAFETRLRDLAASDPQNRIRLEAAADPELMAIAPLLCWTNRTRIDAINGWRRLFELPDDCLGIGEPVIVESIDLPPEAKKSRIKLERLGVIKGAQARFLGLGAKKNFARLCMGPGEQPISVASIVRIERAVGQDAHVSLAARRGVTLGCAAAITVHKAQGSEFPCVSIFGPDIEAAARSGRVEAGMPLWRRLAYVALTRAQREVRWITNKRMKKPTRSLQEIMELENERAIPSRAAA